MPNSLDWRSPFALRSIYPPHHASSATRFVLSLCPGVFVAHRLRPLFPLRSCPGVFVAHRLRPLFPLRSCTATNRRSPDEHASTIPGTSASRKSDIVFIWPNPPSGMRKHFAGQPKPSLIGRCETCRDVDAFHNSGGRGLRSLAAYPAQGHSLLHSTRSWRMRLVAKCARHGCHLRHPLRHVQRR